jgi:hypothetical protein
LVAAGCRLPVENEVIPVANSRLFCVDPREGVAVVEFAKPVRTGVANPNDPRKTLCVANVPVDPNARPLFERVECHLQIDHDYVVTVTLRSTARGAETKAKFHDLDFLVCHCLRARTQIARTPTDLMKKLTTRPPWSRLRTVI